MNLQIKDDQYLPSGFGKPASTYYYIVDVDSTKKTKYLSKKTGKFITSKAFNIKYDGFYTEEQANLFLKNYLKNEKISGVKTESKYPTINFVKKLIKEQVRLKEGSSQQEIEDIAVDLIDYLGKQLPTHGYLQNKRIINFFQDAGITDTQMIKKIYNRALQLNRE